MGVALLFDDGFDDDVRHSAVVWRLNLVWHSRVVRHAGERPASHHHPRRFVYLVCTWTACQSV